MGAKKIIQRAFPNCDLIEISGFPNASAEKLDSGEVSSLLSAKREPLSEDSFNHQVENISNYVDADIAILPGCVLYENVFRKYYPTLRQLSERDIDIVLLGVSSVEYDNETTKLVRDFIKNLEIDVMITRDPIAYEQYSDFVKDSYNGIDCAFFINDWYQPPMSNQEFVISTFDRVHEEGELPNMDNRIIRPIHEPFGYTAPYNGYIRTFLDKYKERNSYKKGNVFISDSLKDYLFWYANGIETHSDRIHACIPSLAYGNKAQFYYDTDRASLFSNVSVPDIKDKPVKIDMEKLNDLKKEQVENLRMAVDNI